MLPVYDLWWLRTTADDTARSEREVRAGIGHSDGYVQFRSEASRRSPWMKFENDYLLDEKCKREEGSYRAVCVLLGEASPHVETWYDATVRIETQDSANEAFDRSVAELIAAITSSPISGATTGVGLDTADTLATLLTALDDETLEARSHAAVLLSFLHGSQLDQAQLRSVIDVLAGALSARDSEIAHSALRSIGALGPRAIAASPALARFLRSNASSTLRAQATIALNRIGPTAEAVEGLAAAATDFRSGIQLAAVTQLGEWGSAASAAVPALTWLADTDETHLRIVALTRARAS